MVGKKILALISVFWVGFTLYAQQNNTNSPYTRFGYGKLADTGFARTSSMGGIGIGFRQNNNINHLNPAAYSAIDTTSFMFEIGFSGLLSRYASSSGSAQKATGNIDYFAMQFPIKKGIGVSLGITPYAFTGYSFNTEDSVLIPSTTGNVYLHNHQYFVGSGGISQVYLGTSIDIARRLSLGVNGYYMFGNTIHYRSSGQSFTDGRTSYNVSSSTILKVNALNARFGVQYHQTLRDNRDAITIGAIYEFKHNLASQYRIESFGVDTILDTLSNVFQLPDVYGLGFTYSLDNRILFGAEVQYLRFSQILFQNTTNNLNDRLKISAGAELTNRAGSNRYIDRMAWRAGVSYATSYAKVNGKSMNEYAVTFGMGFPFRTNKSMINILLEYGGVGTKRYNMIKENYFKIGINFTLNDNWFYKVKLQ